MKFNKPTKLEIVLFMMVIAFVVYKFSTWDPGLHGNQGFEGLHRSNVD